MSDRRQRRFERTRAAIDDAGQTLLGRMDAANLTVKMLADLADISVATFYSHYESKAELVSHLTEVTSQQLGSSARAILRTGESPAIRLATFVAVVLNDVRRDPDWTRFALSIGGYSYVDDCVVHEPMLELIAAGMADGTFRGPRYAELGLTMTRGAAMAAYGEGLHSHDPAIDPAEVVRAVLLILDTEPAALEAAIDAAVNVPPDRTLRASANDDVSPPTH